MRVISGSAKGLKLLSPDGDVARPTADRIKESLFNIISPYVYNASFLDLFSGSGAIGIEALSRGASDASFIELDSKNIDTINKNIAKARVDKKATVYHIDASKGISTLHKSKKQFDIIFLDPPYLKNILADTIKNILNKNILKKDGIIICEQHVNDANISIEGLYIYKEKKYKITKMVFFKCV